MGWETLAVMGGSAILGAANKPKGISAPDKRSYLGEMQSALSAQTQIQPQLMALEAEYQPLWQRLQTSLLSQQIGENEKLLGVAAKSAGRTGSSMLDTMSPLYARAGQTAMSAYEQMLGGSAGIMSQLERQAAEDLSAGRGLTAEERAYAQQASRAALEARGIQQGNQAAALEVLNDYNLSTARQAQRREFAGTVLAGRANLAGQAYNMYGQPLFQQIAATSPLNSIAFAGGMQGSLGAKIFKPESGYNEGIYGANASNEMQTRLANAQIKAGYGTGMMSMMGSLGGGALSNEKFFG